MLYAAVMSRSLPTVAMPQEPSDESGLLGIGPAPDGPCLRADAARNRARLLDAAARLVAERGAAAVTMEAVAAAASVGKGTVFRRFGDRTGLLMALLDHSAKRLQADFLSGPPPLGPGAPPADRLRAFGAAMLRWHSEQLDLLLAAQPEPARRLAHPTHRVLVAHVAFLLREAAPDADCELRAQALVGYLDPAVVHHLLNERGMPLERLRAGWDEMVVRLVGTDGAAAG
ncbi:helix-turn-helix transcriptional regulator [Streptomyces sp. 130]|uniref:TetR/AcrR family transcriptional regulator n=1 Tax=Streptomyces sp. 130 TaxID=2591006 RepID=UPI00117D7081|nr:TetR/AcrR family transcriptional regulator [Streptomyces sp. 130]TRV78306.1 helix-turn-helix transcriptional regulator [Streptomyces sp. 130]